MELTNLENMQQFATFGATMMRGQDDLLIVRFYKRPVLNPRKSKEAGRQMYDAVDYVYIQQPGERDTTDRPIHDGDKMRFPRQWMQYQQNTEQVPEGTPLSVLFVEPNEVAIPPYLNGLGIHTVEQLECLSANAISNVGLGGQDWVNKAKQFIDYARKGKGFHHLDRDNKRLNNELQVAQQQIAAMKAQLDQLMAERYNQTGMPNRRPQAHASIAQRQFMVPEGPPLQPSQSEDQYPDPGTPMPDIVLSDDGVRPDQSIPVFRDPGAARRGRPPGSKNRPSTED